MGIETAGLNRATFKDETNQSEIDTLYDYVGMKEEEARMQKARDFHLQAASMMYEKGTAYTNVIMIGGYAAYFAIWQNSQLLMHPNVLRISAALMTFSLSIFVIWEIKKSLKAPEYAIRLLEVTDSTPDQWEQKEADFKRWKHQVDADNLRNWKTVLYLTIIPAATAVSLHFCAFIWFTLINI